MCSIGRMRGAPDGRPNRPRRDRWGGWGGGRSDEGEADSDVRAEGASGLEKIRLTPLNDLDASSQAFEAGMMRSVSPWTPAVRPVLVEELSLESAVCRRAVTARPRDQARRLCGRSSWIGLGRRLSVRIDELL